MMEASKLARLKEERHREAEAYLALTNDEGRGLSPEKLSALRAATRFRVRRHTCDPSQGDEALWLHDKIMAACSGEGTEPNSREGMEQGPASGAEQESREAMEQGPVSGGDVEQEDASKAVHPTPASANKGHTVSTRTAHPSQAAKPGTRKGHNAQGPLKQIAKQSDHPTRSHSLPDQMEAGSKLAEPGQQSVDDALMAAAEEQQEQQERSRGEEALQEFKDMQSATAAEVEAKRKAIPKQSMTYSLDTQMLQAEFMVVNGMHLPAQDAYPFSKLLHDDDWRFAPALPQRTNGLYRPLSYAGDEAEVLDSQGSLDDRPSDPGPTISPGFDSSPNSPCPPLPQVQIRNSAPSLFPERSGPSSTSPKRRPLKDPGPSPKPHSNNLLQAFSGVPAGMAAVQAGVTASFIARVPPLIPRSSVSDSGGPPAQGEQQLQEAGEGDTSRVSPRKQRGLPVPADALQPLLHHSLPSPPVQRRSSQLQGPIVDSSFDAKDLQPQLLPEQQAAAEQQQRKQVKLPPLLQKGEPVHRHKANNARGAQAKKPLHITGWVQTGGGMNHRLLSGRKPDKAG